MKRLLLCLLVGGCAATLDSSLPKVVGQPVASVVDKLGMPTSEQTIMGQKVYVWTDRRQDVGLGPVIGAPRLILTPVATEGICTVRVAVDGAGIVTRAEHQGDPEECARYAKRLR